MLRIGKQESLRLMVAVLGISILGLLLLGACSSEEGSQEIVEIRVMASSLGSQSGAMAVALEDIVNKNSEWVRLRVEPTESGEGDGFYVNESAARGALIISGSMITPNMAQLGFPPYAANTDPPLTVLATSQGAVGIYTRDENIKTIRDLAGKQAELGGPGSAQRALFSEVLDACGVGAENVKFTSLGGNAAANALAAGTIDAMYTGLIAGRFADGVIRNGAVPSPRIAAPMQTLGDVYLVDVPADCIDAAREKSGLNLFPLDVEAGSLQEFMELKYDPSRGQTTTHVSYNPGLLASAEVPDDVIYEIVRLAIEHVAVFEDFHAVGYLMQRMGYTAAPKDLVHPGAIRAYEEAGWGYSGVAKVGE